MPLVVALLALARPYDAVPDQDLIWLSDALKLYRDQSPRYMDHPGAIGLYDIFQNKFFGAGGLVFWVLSQGVDFCRCGELDHQI